MKSFITPYKLTGFDKLDSLVEHRTKFRAEFCELNVFETRKRAEQFNLKFNGLTITSMLRGKKVMYMPEVNSFDYFPGETVIIPTDTPIQIDFPEAEIDNPTQCTALAIDNSYIHHQLEIINEKLKPETQKKDWVIDINEVILNNNDEMASLSSKLLRVFTGDDPFRDYNIDLILRELLLNIIRVQNLKSYRNNTQIIHSQVYLVMQYIMSRINQSITVEDLCNISCMSKSTLYRAFIDEVGAPPGKIIIDEKLNYAKKLLLDKSITIKEIAYASGFNDPNYFCRIFKKYEGVSPNVYRENHTAY
ncbi:MAG: helix-turn-helix domain-containing protein [Bacteroidetes bacterium]|nr:helix-turn-helix domain-containing protein [Bacteroidota bacterium]